MTHPLPFVPATRASVTMRAPDPNGWYVFHPGEEVRCPGQAPHKKAGISTTCNKYIMTVESGIVCVRIEAGRETNERRQYPRFTKRCPHRDGCGTPLEIEARAATRDDAA